MGQVSALRKFAGADKNPMKPMKLRIYMKVW